MNPTVKITKRVRTNKGPRFCPVVIYANGRIKPDWVLVQGKPERHPEGAYYVEWCEGSKRVRQSAGNDANAAEERDFKEAKT